MDIEIKILNTLKGWNELINIPDQFPVDIIALNFGIQRVFDGYEIYLEGYDWVDKSSEIWLFDIKWTPDLNYIKLGEESLKIDRSEMILKYKEIIGMSIKDCSFIYPKSVIIITVCDSAGVPEFIIE
ncbi:MAG: hypothetical protein NVV82_12945 [Sporocytophaga sp.]|jgi:hypothetical protein|nr:hypothetical protein [Sporocytophaga sp.]